MKRTVVCLIALFLIMGFCAVPIRVHGDYSGNITINSDGLVTPSDAPIVTSDNITYVLIGDVNGSIDVMRDNIIIDGAAHTVQTSLDPYTFYTKGIYTNENRINITIKNCNISGFYYGIYFANCSNWTVSKNNLTNNREPIWCLHSDSSTISGNIFNRNGGGIYAQESNYTTILSNYFSEDGGYIRLSRCDNSSIQANNLTDSTINIIGCHNDQIIKNDLHGKTFLFFGIQLILSTNNIIADNNVTNYYYGFRLSLASNNSITENTIMNNTQGIWFDNSTENDFHHNNLSNNNQSVAVQYSHINLLDNGFEGNYWSDYNGTDNNQDGIGDTPYTIDANNIDHYPLMGTFQSFNVTFKGPSPDYRIVGFEEVDIVSNSTISSVEYVIMVLAGHPYSSWEERSIILHPVSGGNGTVAFCRILVPNNLLNTSDSQIVRGQVIGKVSKLPCSNNTHTYLYFTYNNSATQYITILPEFPCLLILPLFFITTLLAVTVHRKRMRKTEAQCTTLS